MITSRGQVSISRSSRGTTDLTLHSTVEKAVQRVREGAAIHLALKQTTYFPPMSIHMIASGEASGQLENMLERVAANQEIFILLEIVHCTPTYFCEISDN